jgi:hypothetical protein
MSKLRSWVVSRPSPTRADGKVAPTIIRVAAAISYLMRGIPPGRYGRQRAAPGQRWSATDLPPPRSAGRLHPPRTGWRDRAGEGLDDLPAECEEIRATLLETFDRQQQITAAARLVARHLTLGHPPDALIATLAQALLREDAGFHAYQMLEAGVWQFREWGNGDQGRHILIAVARYLAAHFPTQRALLQTADIATRLMRGGELHREAQAAG